MEFKTDIEREYLINTIIYSIQKGEPVVIVYCDTLRNVTLRKIQPIEIHRDKYKTQVVAFCFLRNEFRQFRMGGIIEVYTKD